MKTISPKVSTQSVTASALKSSATRQAMTFPESELSTAELTFVSQAARARAIRKGAGVMIGDYFVGVTTAADMLFSHPAIVY
jgi:hypothetical protein